LPLPGVEPTIMMSLDNSLDRQTGKLSREEEERFLVWYSVLKSFRVGGLDSKSFTALHRD